MDETQQYSAAEMERMMKVQDVLLKAAGLLPGALDCLKCAAQKGGGTKGQTPHRRLVSCTVSRTT